MDLERAPPRQPGHEQATRLGPAQQVARIAPAGQGAGEARVDPVDHGDVGQRPDQHGVLAGEHLVDHVVLDEVAVVDARGVDRVAGSRRACRQRRQLQRRGPALGIGDGPADLALVQVGRQPLQEDAGLLRREPHLPEAHLAELAPGPQAVEGERQVPAGRHHRPQPGRQVLEEPGQRPDQQVVVDHVGVVNDEGGVGRGPVVEVREQRVDRGRDGARRPQRGQGAGGAPGRQRVERGDDAAPQPGRVAVALVERQPRRRQWRLGGPAREQGGLPRPGRRHDQGQRTCDGVVQQVVQAGTADVVGNRSGRARRPVRLDGGEGHAARVDLPSLPGRHPSGVTPPAPGWGRPTPGHASVRAGR